MLKVYTIFYNILLIAFIVLNFVASIIVGVAGHAADDKPSDYIIYIFIIITIISLFVYSREIVTSSILKYINIILVGVFAISVSYTVTEAILEVDNVSEIFIPIAIAFLFIILSISLIRAIIIHKPLQSHFGS